MDLANDELLSNDALAELLKVSPLTVRDWRKRPGVGPTAIRVGGSVRYSRREVERWIAQQNGLAS